MNTPATLTPVFTPADSARQEALAHFGEVQEGAEVCYCSNCDGFYLANPYPCECPGNCGWCGVRVGTTGYYYAWESVHPPYTTREGERG